VKPIYTTDNCKFAYQLCWSLTLFWEGQIPSNADWLVDLQAATEPDGVRILRHRFAGAESSLFLVSTHPDLQPSRIPWSVKGRLQHLLRDQLPVAFQRNYDLRSVGSTKGEKVLGYVASQIERHHLDETPSAIPFKDLQIVDPAIDLMQPRFTAHGRHSCNLHIVMVHAGRWSDSRTESWMAIRDMIRKASSAKGHLLARAGIVTDHVHLSLGIHPDEAPGKVALSYMNNIAFAYGMQPVLMHSCYVAGFGEYDLGSIHEEGWGPWCKSP
jgi:REP element-mobilizing transposase RayT